MELAPSKFDAEDEQDSVLDLRQPDPQPTEPEQAPDIRDLPELNIIPA